MEFLNWSKKSWKKVMEKSWNFAVTISWQPCIMDSHITFISNHFLSRDLSASIKGNQSAFFYINYCLQKINFKVAVLYICVVCPTCCGQLWVRHMFCGRDLWWTIPLHIFHCSCWDTLWIPNDHMDLCQTPCVQVPVFSRHWGHVVNLDQSQALFQFLPTGLHGLCFGYCFSSPLPLRSLTNGPLFRVRFGESLVVRLYSEIGHIHLSIEAQCVTTLLPLGDCHTTGLSKIECTVKM